MLIKIAKHFHPGLFSILLLIHSLINNQFLYGQTYSFKFYNAAEGLTPTALNKIFQDSRGILWFGGIGGLSNYDGYKFNSVFENFNTQVIVKDINEDHKGNIWVATEGNGIAIIKSKTNSIIWLNAANKKISSNYVNKILFDKDKNVWLATEQGILILKKDSSKIKITTRDGLISNSVNNLAMDSTGAVWVSDGGLAKISFEKGEIKSIERIHKLHLISLAVGKDNSILFGTVDLISDKRMGVYRYKDGKQIKILEPANYTDPIKPLCIVESDDGVVWVGTTRGCFLISKNKIERIRSKNGLINENVSSIIKDREGTIWISTSNGVYKLIKRYFINFTERDGLISSGILSGIIDHANNVWFGGWSGLYKIDQKLNLIVQKEICFSNSRQVHSLIEDKNKNILAGKYLGLSRVNNGFIEDINLNRDKKNIFIKSMAMNSTGDIYLGLIGEIIILRNYKVYQIINRTNGLLSSSITSLNFDKKNNLWFNQESNGCGFIHNDSIRYFSKKDGLPSNYVSNILVDSEENIWAATSNGLAVFDKLKEKFRLVNIANKQSISIRCLNEDSQGHLWIGTDIGVFEWKDSLISHLDTRDGLVGDVINSILVDKDDNIYFGTNSGISILKNFSLLSKIPIPKLWINVTSPIDENKILYNVSQLDYNQNSIHFKLNCPSYYEEQSVKFTFMLIGFENNWCSPTSQRIVRYVALDPGKYTFVAKAKNRNGEWSSAAFYNFEILPPFWHTWWFISIAIIFIVGILRVFYTRRINYLRKETATQQKFSKLLIESQEAERKRIASELHDGLGQELLTIINRAKIALKNPERYPPENQLQLISDSALNSIEEVRRIARNLHPYQLDNLGLTNIINSMIEKIKDTTEIKVEYYASNIDNILPVEKEINIFRIIQECINNIVKHSRASFVKILIEKTEDRIKIFIQDNGIGISNTKKEEIFKENKGFGLWGIRERVKFLNGNFNLESSEVNGTTINIDIPYEKINEQENQNIIS